MCRESQQEYTNRSLIDFVSGINNGNLIMFIFLLTTTNVSRVLLFSVSSCTLCTIITDTWCP